MNGAGGAWRTISVALHADAGQYVATMASSAGATTSFGDTVEKTTKKSGASWTSFGKVVAAGALVAGIALAAFIGASIRAAAEFESRMAAVAAVSGATEVELDSLREKALQLGADTSFSASQAASAMEELVKAGVPVADVLNGAADATVALAAAGEVDLTKAAEISASAMNQFGLTAGELPKIADLVAGAANVSAIGVEDFGMSLSQVGAVANLTGASFEDTATAITAMGKAGIVGSDAGTSLKTFLQRLIPTTTEAREEMERLGIVTEDGANQFFDAQGNMRDFDEVAQVLQDSLAGMTREQKLAALSTLFGSDAIRAAAVFAEEGAEGYNTLAEAMGNVSAEDVAEKRLDTLAGSVEKFKGSVETMLITSGGIFTTLLKPIVDGATEFVNVLSSDPATMFDSLLSTLEPLLPFWHDLVDTGENIIDVLVDIDDAAQPVVDWLAQMGGAVVVGGLTLLGTTLSALTGFLADNEAVIDGVVRALTVLAAIKTFTFLAGQVENLTFKLYDMGGAVDRSKTAQNLGLITSGVRDITANLATVPAATERMSAGMRVGIDKVKTGFRGLTSAITSPTVAIAGLTIGVDAMIRGLSQAHSEAQATADALKGRGFDERSLDDLNNYAISLDLAAAAAEKNDEAAGGWAGTLKGTAELLTPMENKILDNAVAAGDLGKASEIAADAAERMTTKYRDVSQAIGNGLELGIRDVEKWVNKLDLDPATMSVEEMVVAINEARWAARNGSVGTDMMSDALVVLADETSNSTEKLDAWKESLDAALGIPMGIFDAETGLASSLREMTMAFATNGDSITANTEEATANRQALSDAAQSVIDLATAYGQGEGGIEAANLKLAEGREKLLAAGEAAGISRDQMSDYLDELGLTPEFVESQIKLSDPGNAQKRIDDYKADLSGLDGRVVTTTVMIQQAIQSLGTVDANGNAIRPGAINAERENRWGGLYSYARGGMTPAHVAHGTRYKWAEPETGGEAFFPRFGDLARNEAQMAQVAGWYGGQYVPRGAASAVGPMVQRQPLVSAYQGISAAEVATIIAASKRPSVNVTTNARTDADPQAISQHTERVLMFGGT